MSSVLTLHGPGETADLAAALLHSCPERRVFALRGALGVGKTTLIKAFCAELGVAEGTGSPSFAIVNEYRDAHGEPVYHFDLYRLKDVSELDGIGFDEYLDSGHYCFIEWPELSGHRLPLGTVRIDLERIGTDRMLRIDLAPLPMTNAPMA